MSDFWVFVIALALVVVYAILKVRLVSFVQPLRLEVINLAARLSEDPDVPSAVRRDAVHIERYLFSQRYAWMLVLSYPIGIYHTFRRHDAVDDFKERKPLKARDVSSMYMRLSICMASNSPLTMAIYILEVALMLLFFMPAARGMRAAVHSLIAMHNGNGVGRKNHGGAS